VAGAEICWFVVFYIYISLHLKDIDFGVTAIDCDADLNKLALPA